MENNSQDNDLPNDSEHASNWSIGDSWESEQMLFKKMSSLQQQTSTDTPQVGVATLITGLVG
eukprot:14537510-Ditylum_brightwellii.AAC.1